MWRDFIKNLGSKRPQTINPFHIFITSGDGVGKSHLTKAIHMSLSKVLMYKGGDPEKPRILLLVATRVAVVHINGTTIHCEIKIYIGGKMCPLNDCHRAILRNKLSEVKIIIIDEIPMVSSMLLYEVNQKLNEIFGYSDQLPFAGMSVIVCADFYQLPPFSGLPVYSSTRSIKNLLTLDLWRKFKMAGLTEVMR